MTPYKTALTDCMAVLAIDANVIFMGQAVAFKGTGMSETFERAPRDRLLELPVFENTQLGMATGMALEGLLPVCVFPRVNFLLCAADQLVNHLEKIQTYSIGRYRPKVIIRTAVGATKPLYPGAQHVGDYYLALKALLRNIDVVELHTPDEVYNGYKAALVSERSMILIERAENY